MELLAFGKTGWGDELFYATLMTIAVSVTAIFIGFFLDASINCPNLEKFFLVIFFAFITFILQNFQMLLFLKFHHLDGYLF